MRNAYFDGCADEAEIKRRYRDLAKQLHPDCGGSNEAFQTMSADYIAALRGEYRKTKSPEETDAAIWDDCQTMDAVEKIIALPGIVIEIVGRWVWVTGDTRPLRDELKAAGFWWASKKVAWYWHKPEDRSRGSGMTLDEIKDKYGARRVDGRRAAALVA